MSDPNANIFKAIDAGHGGTSFHEVVSQLRKNGNRILTALMNMVATILFEVRSKTVKRARDLKESAEMHRTIYRDCKTFSKPQIAQILVNNLCNLSMKVFRPLNKQGDQL